MAGYPVIGLIELPVGSASTPNILDSSYRGYLRRSLPIGPASIASEIDNGHKSVGVVVLDDIAAAQEWRSQISSKAKSGRRTSDQYANVRAQGYEPL
jgi:hypothetical protein